MCSVNRDWLWQEMRERICRAEGKEQTEVLMEAAKEQSALKLHNEAKGGSGKERGLMWWRLSRAE